VAGVVQRRSTREDDDPLASGKAEYEASAEGADATGALDAAGGGGAGGGGGVFLHAVIAPHTSRSTPSRMRGWYANAIRPAVLTGASARTYVRACKTEATATAVDFYYSDQGYVLQSDRFSPTVGEILGRTGFHGAPKSSVHTARTQVRKPAECNESSFAVSAAHRLLNALHGGNTCPAHRFSALSFFSWVLLRAR